MSTGWFDPSTASALRQHIRHQVLVLLQEQAEPQMRGQAAFDQAVREAEELKEQFGANLVE